MFKILFLPDPHAFPVIEACPFKPPIRDAKAERRNKDERRTCARTGSDNIACVLRDLGLVEYDVQVFT